MDSLLAVLPWTALSGLIVGGIALYGQLIINRRTIAAQKESQREIIASQQHLADTTRRRALLDKRAEAYIGYIRELQAMPHIPDIDLKSDSIMIRVSKYRDALEAWKDACKVSVAPLHAYASDDVAPRVLKDQRLTRTVPCGYCH